MIIEIKGDLIELAKEGHFDVITHGCNCFCKMGSGIAVPMAKEFGCNLLPLENKKYKGDYNKMGQIDYKSIELKNGKNLIVVNSYTQHHYGTDKIQLDYDALTLCLRKINFIFKGKHIGLPKIGCGLAGGDWKIVKEIIKEELNYCDVTVVIKD